MRARIKNLDYIFCSENSTQPFSLLATAENRNLKCLKFSQATKW